MIRKAVIVVLTLGAVIVSIGWVLSHRVLTSADCLCRFQYARSTDPGWHLRLDFDSPSQLCVVGAFGELGIAYVERCPSCRDWNFHLLGVKSFSFQNQEDKSEAT